MKRAAPLGPGKKSLERGSTFELTRTRKKRSGFTPASGVQKAKARMEDFCWGCGRERSDWLSLDPAHLCPRSKGGCDHQDCVIVLCRAGDGSGCHRAFDDGELDLLRVVTARYERFQAECAHALTHMTPVQLVERLAGAKVRWTP